ncbi:MAG: hypothetical protein IKU82_07225 [Clostridia bacterium]|nr:hypothetical protein [Clostridia bacterium]
MKKVLSILIATTFLLCLCACNNSTDEYSSAEVEIIYEDVETVYDNENAVNSIEQSSSQKGEVISSDTSNQNNSFTTNETTENTFQLNDTATLQKIKLNGRCEKTQEGISLNMAASAIEFNTNSSSVMVEVDTSSTIYYTVMVDGEITMQHEPIESQGKNYVIIARGLGSGSHNIKFIRDGESRANLEFTVASIQLDDGATLLARDGDKKVIEFLGDSLTSGFGNLALNSTYEPSNLKYMSSTKAYPFLIANKLGFDYRIVSMSSIALGKREEYPTFSEFYSLENYHNDKTKKYASSNPQDVDIVVVNLGTNDVGSKLYDAKNYQSVSEYEQLFTDLITNIGYRKDAKIVFITGVWNPEPITAINGAITKLKSQGYNDVYSLTVKECKSGGGSHPSEKEHTEIADAIENFFKTNGII